MFTPAAGALHFGWQAAFLPLLLLQTAALSLGVSLWFSAMTAKYRDITHLMPVLVQLWMFATVIVPASRVPAEWRWVLWANPASAIVEGFRICLLGRGTLTPAQLLVSLAITAFLLLTGLLLFQRVERTAADTA
jgi:lipopolysaccharide transport system permease protein